ncbi:polysaccharide biosynthesis protein (plasmid) [Sphingomonas paeninsulae]|uniref:Polysaccharide biosynthesis protein n=1 Tax=Sphingomonas paeninsulae TaxID=2319844 RepID=A0A494TH53_SPHPE|nr:polysaccharide biosynthesis protein [Sphingomonas paeninsulae]
MKLAADPPLLDEGVPVPHRTWRSIAQNTSWMLLGKIVGAVLSLIYLGMATRALGKTGFGEFVIILGAGQTIAALVSFETWQILLRFGMDRIDEGRSEKLGRLVAFCMVLDLSGVFIGTVLAVVGVQVLGPFFGWSDSVKHDALIFCILLLISERSAPTGILRLFDRFGIAAFAETVTPVVRLIGAVVVVSLGASVRGLLAAWAIAEMATAITHWILALRLIPLHARWWRLDGLRAVPGEHPGLWRFAGIVNATSTFGLVGKQIAVLLVGASVGAAAAGGYRIAHQLGQALANISEMLSRATFTELMRARATQTAQQLALLFRKASIMAGLTASVMIAIMLLLGKLLLSVLGGGQYAAAYPLVLLLGTAAALDAAGVSFEPALLATGRAWLAFRLRLVSGATLLAALFVALEWGGTTTAAAATCGVAALTLILFGTAAWRAVHYGD